MTFPLEAVRGAVAARAGTWSGLGIEWQIRPVHPNHGKAVVVGQSITPGWWVQFAIWATGESEIDVIRPADELTVTKHYDLAGLDDLEMMLDELLALFADNRIPDGAFVS